MGRAWESQRQRPQPDFSLKVIFSEAVPAASLAAALHPVALRSPAACRRVGPRSAPAGPGGAGPPACPGVCPQAGLQPLGLLGCGCTLRSSAPLARGRLPCAASPSLLAKALGAREPLQNAPGQGRVQKRPSAVVRFMCCLKQPSVLHLKP